MKPDMSEFTYGFALTAELLWAPGVPFVALPVFPSLTFEGGPGGGWDVKIPRTTIPLFLQFKISDFMKRGSCKEAQQGFAVPCYRMHFRPARISEQHERLLALESNSQEVYYCAPAFHRTSELDQAFLKRQIGARSLWLRPSEVGALPDDDDHSFSFRLGGPYAFFSERRDVEVRSFESVGRHIVARHRREGVAMDSLDYWRHLAGLIQEIAGRRRRDGAAFDATAPNEQPVRRVAYYAAVLLNAQLCLAWEREGAAAQQEDGRVGDLRGTP